VVAVAAAVAGAAVWFLFLRGSGGSGKRRYVTAPVDTGDVTETITATGTVQAVETVQIGALVSGRVITLSADENDEVTKGQVMAVIDPEPYRVRVDQAQAQLAMAGATLERAKAEARRVQRERDRIVQLSERGAAGTAQVDDAESAVELARAGEKSAAAEWARAKAAVKAAALDLDRTTILSPIDGLVLSRAVEEGQSVNAGFQTPTLFTVARDLGEMEVRAAIDEADVGKVRERQEARFTVDAYPGEDFVGEIAQVKRSPTVTQNVVTFEALIRVKNPDKRLWPGMTATVRVVTADKKGVIRVPNAALRFKAPADLIAAASADRGKPGDGKPRARGDRRPRRRVWKLVAGSPEAVEVELGISDDEYTEAVSGALTAGDELVTEIQGDSGAPSSPGGAPGFPGQRRGGRRRM
jgi:HlyD family secretion protein